MPWLSGSHLKQALQGSSNAALASSSNPKRKPALLAHLQAPHHLLHLTNTFNAEVFAIACVAFWDQCRLAKVTVDGPFNPTKHASHLSRLPDGLSASNFRHGGFQAPRTKASLKGEDILWIDSKCPCSTLCAFNNHMQINSHVPPSTPLFAYETNHGDFAPMKREYFMDCCSKLWTAEGLEPLNGHTFCIGGTTQLLPLGVDPFIVMVQGCWKLNAFLDYWHHCKDILPNMIGLALEPLSYFSFLSNMAAFKYKLLAIHH